jgi:membrane-bound serine protease (ClpP class)
MSKLSGIKTWLIVAVALADDIAVVAVVYLALRFFDVDIPVSLGIGAGVVLGGFVFMVHRAVVPALRERRIMGAEAMVGLTAKVTETLKPEGTVRVAGESWNAKSVEGEIEAGAEVVVVGIHGLHLEVKRKVK